MTKRVDTRNMKRLRAEFFADGKLLDADPDTRHLADCWLCKQHIDYNVEPHTTPDSHNLDHAVTYSDAPELLEDPTNFRHSHRTCNEARGASAPSVGLGEPVADWW